MALSDARRERLQRIEEAVTVCPGLTSEQLAARYGVSRETITKDLTHLGLQKGKRDLAGELYLHAGLWCVHCDCGEFVPICDEEGVDECPQCGQRYAVRVVRR